MAQIRGQRRGTRSGAGQENNDVGLTVLVDVGDDHVLGIRERCREGNGRGERAVTVADVNDQRVGVVEGVHRSRGKSNDIGFAVAVNIGHRKRLEAVFGVDQDRRGEGSVAVVFQQIESAVFVEDSVGLASRAGIA